MTRGLRTGSRGGLAASLVATAFQVGNLDDGIGDGATLLPGTTLSKSIPSGVVMQGNPARMALGDFDNTPLRFQPELDSAEYIAARRST